MVGFDRAIDGGRNYLVAVSGYFDLPHEGHTDYFERARRLAYDRAKELLDDGMRSGLVVIVNNPTQSEIKYPGRGQIMPFETRLALIRALRSVDYVVPSIDLDGTVCRTLENLHPDAFAKGGDRFSREIPESEVCKRLEIDMYDGIGEKLNSSSEIVKKMPRAALLGLLSSDGSSSKVA